VYHCKIYRADHGQELHDAKQTARRVLNNLLQAAVLSLPVLLEYEVIWGILVFWLLLLGGYLEGENSTSGPQPYQPYEAEVTNSPISNTFQIFRNDIYF